MNDLNDRFPHMSDEIKATALHRGMMYWDPETHTRQTWNSDDPAYLVIWSYLGQVSKGMDLLFNTPTYSVPRSMADVEQQTPYEPTWRHPHVSKNQ